jgi:hypothetical protein
LINVKINPALQRKGWVCHDFAKAAEKCSKRLLDSRWALLKGYRKAAGGCPKATR